MSLVLDSGLDQNIALSYHQKDDQLTSPPDVMPRAFRIEGLVGDDWQQLARIENNYQRFCHFAIAKKLDGIRFVLDSTWGNKGSRVYAFWVE